jgi:hypothetical protein
VLVFASAIATALAFEVAARVIDWRQDVHAFEAWQNLSAPRHALPPDREASLGNVIRLAKNPRIVYELNPDFEFRMIGVPCRTNECRFRGPSVPVAKPPGGYRIVVQDDSVGFGHGVDEPATFARRLEDMLRVRFPGRPIDVVNTSVPGYNTAMEVETLVDKGLQFAPDVVVYHYVGNDLDLPNLIWKPRSFWTLQRSFLWDKVSQSWSRRDPWTDRPFGTAPVEDHRFVCREGEVDARYRDLVGIDMFRRELHRLKELSVARGFHVVVSAHWQSPPYVAETSRAENLSFVAIDERVRAHMQERGIADYNGSELVLSAKDPHPSAIGRRLIAEVLFAQIEADGALPR